MINLKDRLKSREEVKLGQLLEINSGKDYKHLNTGNIPVYGSGGIMLYVDKAISLENSIGIGRKGTITKPSKLIAPFWTVDTLFWCTTKNDIDYNYIYYLVNNINFKKYNEGSTLPSLSSTTIKSIIVKIHDKINQKKIGEFLSSIDILIEKQEEYIKQFKYRKYGCRNLIFTNINVNKPMYLGEISKIYQSKTISQADFTSEGYSVFGANGYIGKYFKYNHERSQVTISCRGEYSGEVNFVKKRSWITGNSMIINVDENEKVNKRFIYEQLTFQNLKYLVTGSSQPQIVKADVEIHKILVPPLEEQNKIASLLSSMDKLIELNEQKLEELKNKKKYYLNEIFR